MYSGRHSTTNTNPIYIPKYPILNQLSAYRYNRQIRAGKYDPDPYLTVAGPSVENEYRHNADKENTTNEPHRY